MIIIKKNVQGGMPVIKGTRLTVWEILQALDDGFSIKEIVFRCKRNDVDVTERDVKEAIGYASKKVGVL